MAWLVLVPLLPGLFDAFARDGHDRMEGLSRHTQEAEAQTAELQQECSNLQEESRQQREAHERRLQQLEQEREAAKKSLNEQPTEPLVVLQEHSRKKYGIQKGSRNVQLTGVISCGKSFLGNVLAGISQDSRGKRLLPCFGLRPASSPWSD